MRFSEPLSARGLCAAGRAHEAPHANPSVAIGGAGPVPSATNEPHVYSTMACCCGGGRDGHQMAGSRQA
jgi:hypothetical protein